MDVCKFLFLCPLVAVYLALVKELIDWKEVEEQLMNMTVEDGEDYDYTLTSIGD